MHPFIHIGSVTLGTYGLLVAAALICGFLVMRADIARRHLGIDAEGIIGVTGLAGLVGARLYHLLESPAEFFANPWRLLFSTMGFAWYGAVIGGFVALVFLARSNRIKMLLMLDLASPAAALGYGVGRIGCLISGDGDYGVPTTLPWGMSFPNGLVPTTGTCVDLGWSANCRVHPTPIYEFLAALVIAHILWRVGRWAIAAPANHPAGEVFGWYLILTGIARFFVEFIRINPRSFFGMSNAQAASIAGILAGAILLVFLRSRRPTPSAARGRA